jgi:hypothetical protein
MHTVFSMLVFTTYSSVLASFELISSSFQFYQLYDLYLLATDFNNNDLVNKHTNHILYYHRNITKINRMIYYFLLCITYHSLCVSSCCNCNIFCYIQYLIYRCKQAVHKLYTTLSAVSSWNSTLYM